MVTILDRDFMSVKSLSKGILALFLLLFPLAAGGNTWLGFRSTTGIFIMETMIAVTGMLVLGFYNDLFEQVRRLGPFQWLVLLSSVAYLSITIVSMLLSIDMFKSEGDVFVYLSAVILLFSLNFTFDEDRAEGLLVLLVIAGTVVAGIGIYQAGYWFSHFLTIERAHRISNPDILNMIRYTFRATGTFEHPNVMAGFLLMIMPPSYLLAIEKRGNLKYLFYALALLLTVGLFVTYSRAGILLYLLSLPFMFLVLRKRFSPKKILLSLLAIVALAGIASGIIISTYSSYNKRTLAHKYSPSRLLVASDMSFIARKNYAITALRVIRHNPWFGTGPGTYEIAARGYQVGAFYSRHVHNNYLELTSEVGIFGLISYLLFIIGTIILLLRAARHGVLLAGMILLSIGCFAIHTAVDFDYSSPAVVWLLFIYGAIALILGKEKRTHEA